MAHSEPRSAIVLAIGGNALVTIVKAIAWVLSGSGAMLSETVHSLVDTLNQGLLAAIGILVFGGALSIEHGIEHALHAEVPEQVPVALGVLVLAFFVEGYVLVSVLRGVRKSRGGRPWSAHLAKQSPGTITVIVEDTAAVLGCLIAGGAIGLSAATQDGRWDAIGQIVIGGLLALVGVALIYRNRGMLIGLALPREEVIELRRFLEDLDGVERVTDLKTRQMGLGRFGLKAEVVFSGGFLARKTLPGVARALPDLVDDEAIRDALGHFAEGICEEQARHVDWLESEIRKAYPDAVNIDLEPHVRDF